MENSSSGDRRERSGQNRQGQRGGRRRQNNRGDSRNSGGSSSNRRPRGGNSSQGGGKREYRPSNRGRQAPKKQSFLQKILSFLGLGGDSKAKTQSSESSGSSKQRSGGQEQARRDNNRSDDKVEVTSERLYVGNLDYKTTGPDLEKHFSQIGTVKSAEIVINRRTQQSKGFAFVEMSSIDEARKAVSSYHNQDFMGRRMLVNGAKSQGAGGEGGERSSNNRRRDESRSGSDGDRNRRGDRSDRGERDDRNNRRRSETREEPRRVKKEEAPAIITTSRLKLDNLDYEVGEDELEELFKGIGVVVSTEVIANPDTHQSKGYGFVEMSHIDEAQRAVEILNNKDFMGRKLNISGAENKATATTADTSTETASADESPEKKQDEAAPALES